MRKFIAVPSALVLALAFSFAVAQEKKSGGVKPGDPAPAFSLKDQDGKTVSLSDHAGKIVVLEWFNDGCPYVVRHHEKSTTMADTAKKYKDKDVVWLAVNTTPGKSIEDNKAVAGKWNIQYPILSDADGSVGKAYGAKTTPHMFIIDKNGTVAYAGAIDNDPEGSKSDRVNLVDKALGELTSGTSVSTPQSKPYGCGVKYSK
jgi:peroxiredoxin